MNIRRWSDLLTTATVVLSIGSYALADRFPALAVGAIPVALLGWFVADVLRLALTRRPISDLLVIAAIAWSAYRVRSAGWTQGLTVSVFCEFLISIILVKMWDRKLPRDTAQILTLSVFLSVGSMLTGASLGMAILLIANLSTLLVAVTVFHLAAGYEAAGIRDDADESRVGKGPRAGAHFAGTLAFSLVAGLVLSGVIFLVMPRGIGLGQLGTFGQPTGGRVTGLADHVDLRQSGLISESARVVLEARFADADQNSLGADGRVFYLRASVLERYERGAWTASRRDEPREENVPAGQHFSLGGTPGREGVWQEIQMRDAPASTPVPLVYRAVDIASSSASIYSVRARSEAVTRRGEPGRFAYIAASAPPVLPDPESVTRAPAESRSRQLALRFDVPRVAQIAREVLKNAGIDPDPSLRPAAADLEACREFERYLRSSFSYTLDTGAGRPGVDPIEWFLTEGRAGHCEYFASAMAGMCRSVGIGARVIAGYAAGEFDASRDAYIVRESNAHAWVEAEVSAGVWWTFDPTPQDTLRARMRPPSGLRARWASALDRLDSLWSTSFISFDENSRRRLLGFTSAPDPWLRRTLDNLRSQYDEGGWRAAAPLLAKAGAWTVVACVLAIAMLRLSRGALARLASTLRARTALRHDPDLARALGHTEFFGKMLTLLRKRGVAKPEWKPPLIHAEEIARSNPRLAEAAALASRLYYRARFGRHALDDEDIRAVHRALDDAARFSDAPRGGNA